MASPTPNLFAQPAKKECEVCFTQVYSVKILPCCKYRFCAECEDRFRLLPVNCRKCPQCREPFPTGDLLTHYFGQLKCDYCLELKNVDDFWFCSGCLKSFCSKCSIKEHSVNHADHHNLAKEWDIQQVHVQCRAVLSSLATSTKLRHHNRAQICDFTKELQSRMIDQLHAKTNGRLVEIREALGHSFGPVSAVDNQTPRKFEYSFPWQNILRKVLQLSQINDSIVDAIVKVQVSGSSDEFATKMLPRSVEALTLAPVVESSLRAVSLGTQLASYLQLGGVACGHTCRSDALAKKLSEKDAEIAALRQQLAQKVAPTLPVPGAYSRASSATTTMLGESLSSYSFTHMSTVSRIILTQSEHFILMTPDRLDLLKLIMKEGDDIEISNAGDLDSREDWRLLASAFCGQAGSLYTFSESSEAHGTYAIDYSYHDGEKNTLEMDEDACIQVDSHGEIDMACIAVTSTDAVYFSLTVSSGNSDASRKAELRKMSFNPGNKTFRSILLLEQDNANFLYLTAKYEQQKTHLLIFVDDGVDHDGIVRIYSVVGSRTHPQHLRDIPLTVQVSGIDYSGNIFLIQAEKELWFTQLGLNQNNARISRFRISEWDLSRKFCINLDDETERLISLGFDGDCFAIHAKVYAFPAI